MNAHEEPNGANPLHVNDQISSRKRLAILVNILTPYRIPIYQILSERFNTVVLIGEREDNRNWEVSTVGKGFRVQKAWGFSIKRRVRDAQGHVVDIRYTHVNPGYIVELIRFRPAAIVSVEMGLRSLISICYGALFRIPVWIWWGGTIHTERGRSLGKRILRKTIFAKGVRRWISYGASSTEYLRSLNIPDNRILEIQNCVDDTLYRQPHEPDDTDLPRPIALVVGQLIGRKGIYQLIEAAAQLQREGKTLSLLFVGDGPEADKLKTNIGRLGLENVHMIDYVPPERMPSVYKSADFLVFPTLEDVWGLVVNEAILSGIPVLSSRFAGCSKELLPSQNIFDPLVPEDFAAALRRATEGNLCPVSNTTLKSVSEVAASISNDIEGVLENKGTQLKSRAR